MSSCLRMKLSVLAAPDRRSNLVSIGWSILRNPIALAEEKRGGSTWRLVKLDIEGNKPAHNAYIFGKARGNRSEIGFITSAAWSPVCKQNIALGTVRTPHGKPGSTVWVEIYYQREMHWARKMAKATVVDKAFWFPPRRSAMPPGPY
jgi:aminomethyltransferase